MNNSFRRISSFALFAAIASGCSEKAKLEPAQQAGSEPPLPKAQNFFVPPMQVPDFVGWKDGQMPSVVSGLTIEKIAGDLKHPRQLLVLPNGDVLVMESNSPGTEAVSTPKQWLAGLIKSDSGKGAKGGDRITLLRKSAAGGEWEQHVFIDKLHSPFGAQLIDDSLYVANTDAVLRFPYQTGETEIKTTGVDFADLPNTINHHWTKSLLASARTWPRNGRAT